MNTDPLISDIVPTLRYDDAPAAVKFLQDAFGFKPVMIVPGDDDTIAHAELSFGNGMVMLGSNLPKGCGQKLTWPVGGASTYCILATAEDVTEHCARAEAAGAVVVMPPTDQEYGGRDYTARDLEGNLWSFGSYRPQV
jgi:uncharacterized glyoxalase superfamily protein PhnB